MRGCCSASRARSCPLARAHRAKAAHARLDDGLPATCNPLRTAGACATPFPSGGYLDEDASSPTGVRVHLYAEMVPASNLTNAPFDTTRYDVADGFSATTPLLAYFPERLDPASLVPLENAETVSVAHESPTLVVDMTTNTLVAHMSEVDQRSCATTIDRPSSCARSRGSPAVTGMPSRSPTASAPSTETRRRRRRSSTRSPKVGAHKIR